MVTGDACVQITTTKFSSGVLFRFLSERRRTRLTAWREASEIVVFDFDHGRATASSGTSTHRSHHVGIRIAGCRWPFSQQSFPEIEHCSKSRFFLCRIHRHPLLSRSLAPIRPLRKHGTIRTTNPQIPSDRRATDPQPSHPHLHTEPASLTRGRWPQQRHPSPYRPTSSGQSP